MKHRFNTNRTLHPMANRTAVFGLALATFGVALLFLSSAQAAESPPNRMTIQSFLTDDTGTPVGTGSPENKTMEFYIFNADSGGEIEFAETQIVTVDDGHFSVVLGEGSQIGSFNQDLSTVFQGSDASDRYLEIVVDAQPLAPRLRLLPAAYAFLAAYANEAALVSGGGVDTGAITDGAVTLTKMDSGSVDSDAIVDGSVASGDILDNTIQSVDIADDTITGSDVADNTITGANIQSETITSSDIVDGTITGTDIQDSTITGSDIADNSVGESKLLEGLFEFEVLAFSSGTNSGSYRFDGPVRDVVEWWPILTGWKLQSGEINTTGTVSIGLFWSSLGTSGVWRLNWQTPLPFSSDVNGIAHILWIPSRLVNDLNSTFK